MSFKDYTSKAIMWNLTFSSKSFLHIYTLSNEHISFYNEKSNFLLKLIEQRYIKATKVPGFFFNYMYVNFLK